MKNTLERNIKGSIRGNIGGGINTFLVIYAGVLTATMFFYKKHPKKRPKRLKTHRTGKPLKSVITTMDIINDSSLLSGLVSENTNDMQLL